MDIQVENLSKRFNYEWIFRSLTYRFCSDQLYAITGPNGSGKSTLLHVLWQQVPPTGGTITYRDGAAAVPLEHVYNRVAIAAPYMELIDEFTLREAIAFHFRFRQPVPGCTTAALLDQMELSHAADKPLQFFSSGMKQRVKLGLAFFTQAHVLFLDEPTTNLDERAVHWYTDLLQRSRPGKIVIIASNQPSEYPPEAEIVDIRDYKTVTKPA
ncbi:MAG: ATP-binding cassette domain-containing protein [Cyclobacteriaceae bacterium]|jgi:ABC-type multidrug transport system ATPase subunit|nr:ATP-binding cassette domain-containing protein [Cyclobacteriaceae bacterium]